MTKCLTKLPVGRLLLPVLAGAFLALLATKDAQAQQGTNGGQAASGSRGAYGQAGPRQPGGFSRLTLSDVWGPAKMPNAPADFGPNFDFPPEPLNGAPLHDPYPE